MPRLVIGGRGGERAFEFGAREIVIGAEASCDVVVAGASVSSVHCKLQPVMGAWKIVDLESDAGTRVNGAYVNQRPLRSGDVIEVGDARIVFHDEPTPAAAPVARPVAVQAAAPVAPTVAPAVAAAPGRAAARAPKRGGADGGERPRRQRARSSGSPLAPLVIVGVLALLAGVGYYALRPDTSPNERVFLRMRAAQEKFDWQTVKAEAAAGDESDPSFGPRIRELRELAEQQIGADAGREKVKEALRAWNAIRAWRQEDNWHNDVEFVQRIDEFLATYGPYGGSEVESARRERAKVAGSVAAGSPRDANDAWSRLQADLEALRQTGQFGLALEKVDAFKTQWGGQDPQHAREADEIRRKLPDEATKWLGLQISKAQMKLDQGTKYQARKILQRAADTVGIPELAQRAIDEIRKIGD